MRFLLSWLQEFVDIPEPPAEFAEAVTRAGFPLEEMEESGGETVFDFEITANRPDVMNHFGLAREAAAIYDRPLRAPRIAVTEGGRSAAEAAAVEIEDPDLCPRYSARVIEGVEVKPSPDWLRKRLELCGVRSVNNIADITNYVLLELGHPTHAFDLDLLAGSKIVVRRARSGEKLLTLDGVERELSPERLVIADAERPVALAGVMGGAELSLHDIAVHFASRGRVVLLADGPFREEASAGVVLTLERLGRAADARRAATAFLALYPDSVHTPRIAPIAAGGAP